MQQFKIEEILGSGTYGQVYKAECTRTKSIVAIKKIETKVNTWNECITSSEVKTLRKLSKHDHIIKLKDVFKPTDNVFLVFEYAEMNLRQIIDQAKELNVEIPEYTIKEILYEIALGLDYIHRSKIMHRDVKPDNILLKNSVIKIADFGFATNDDGLPKTEYICTRNYRAPECILWSSYYTAAIDIWALGVIMLELYLLKNVFAAKNEVEHIEKLSDVLGTPSITDWPEGHELMDKTANSFKNKKGSGLESFKYKLSTDAIDLLRNLLKWNPKNRYKSTDVLRHKYFFDVGKKREVKLEWLFNKQYEVKKVKYKSTMIKNQLLAENGEMKKAQSFESLSSLGEINNSKILEIKDSSHQLPVINHLALSSSSSRESLESVAGLYQIKLNTQPIKIIENSYEVSKDESNIAKVECVATVQDTSQAVVSAKKTKEILFENYNKINKALRRQVEKKILTLNGLKKFTIVPNKQKKIPEDSNDYYVTQTDPNLHKVSKVDHFNETQNSRNKKDNFIYAHKIYEGLNTFQYEKKTVPALEMTDTNPQQSVTKAHSKNTSCDTKVIEKSKKTSMLTTQTNNLAMNIQETFEAKTHNLPDLLPLKKGATPNYKKSMQVSMDNDIEKENQIGPSKLIDIKPVSTNKNLNFYSKVFDDRISDDLKKLVKKDNKAKWDFKWNLNQKLSNSNAVIPRRIYEVYGFGLDEINLRKRYNKLIPHLSKEEEKTLKEKEEKEKESEEKKKKISINQIYHVIQKQVNQPTQQAPLMHHVQGKKLTKTRHKVELNFLRCQTEFNIKE